MEAAPATTLDKEEIARFSAIAEEWWDEHGKFAPLHQINPVRMAFIRHHAVQHFGLQESKIKALEGLTAVDIGCGGGLVAESLARLGAQVTGVDGSEQNIQIASTHANQAKLAINYRATTAETLAAEGKQYDLVLALEVVEHVADVPLFLQSLVSLIKPGGLLIMSTLNRTVKAYGMAILGAEYLLRWLPRGTHDWKKFLKPHELVIPLERAGLTVVEMRGLVLNPLKWQWELSERDLDVNYLLAMEKRT